MTQGESARKHRRSLRLPNFNYSLPAVFFVTICTHDKGALFGKVEQNVVNLNEYGTVVSTCWKEIPAHFPHVELDEFVIMPNHMHGILVAYPITEESLARPCDCRGKACLAPTSPARFQKPGIGSLGTVIGSFKSSAARRISQLRRSPGALVWQRNYYEHIIREERDFQAYRDYIVNNPLRWAEDHENPAAPKQS